MCVQVDPLALMGSLMGAMMGGAGAGQFNNQLASSLAMAGAIAPGVGGGQRGYDRDRRDRQVGGRHSGRNFVQCSSISLPSSVLLDT